MPALKELTPRILASWHDRASSKAKRMLIVANCPKCNALMVQGFIVDHNHGGSRLVSSWVEGAPEKAFWSNTKAPDEKHVPIGTFRCSACGYLESYADRKFGAV